MSDAAMDNVSYETRGGAAWIAIKRPQKLNALNRRTVEEIVAASEQALEAVVAGSRFSLAEAQRLEAGLVGLCFATEDMREGTRAFVEKRPASCKGR